VVGSSRRSAVGRVPAGSTAQRLMQGAPCPVAVVPHSWTAERPETIGVAYVDSDEGREALRGAHALAERAGATLSVITVVKMGLTGFAETEPATAGRFGKDLEDVEGEHRLQAESEARAAVSVLSGDVPVESRPLLGTRRRH
jgi:nucleotide-binding universal stress UspA family protein